MLYSEFILKAKNLTIQQLDNGTWYLEPEWYDILHRNGLGNLDVLKDSYLEGWHQVEDILALEVERRNCVISKKNDVINWVYDVISAVVEPAMLQEESDYIKNVMDFMKLNHDIQNEENKES